MKKIKTWLRTDIGIRAVILSIIVLSSVFVPYLFGYLFGFGGENLPWLVIWIMGVLTLVLVCLSGMLAGILLLGCVAYVKYGEFVPFELLGDIVDWVEDKYDELLEKIKKDNIQKED